MYFGSKMIKQGIKDRGKAEYFHGREKELKAFVSLLEEAQAVQGGYYFFSARATRGGEISFIRRI